jgi:hypothetical protein
MQNFCYHVAIAVGGTSIRAVNGTLLGAGWVDLVDVAPPDDNNTFADPDPRDTSNRRLEVRHQV